MTESDNAPSDDALTEEGLPLAGVQGRILLIACGALAREILDLKAANGMSGVDYWKDISATGFGRIALRGTLTTPVIASTR